MEVRPWNRTGNVAVGSRQIEAWAYDNAGNQTSVTRDGTADTRTYNTKGEVVKANHNNNNFDKSYDFDGIGNRNKTADSLTLPAANNYVSNALNQYSNVNGVARTYDNDGNSLTGVVGTKGQLGEIKWDGNNRLTEVTTADGKTVTVDYDHMGRRFRKSVTTGGEAKYSYFIYSGYNAIAKYTGNSQSALSLQKSYYWGKDLGGGEGTGGMLAEVSHGSDTESLFTLMDGNGNITEHLKSDGTLAAHFEYDSFGNTLVSEGAEASVVDYGFSSRAKDKDLGLVYYNFRYYNAVQGGWINRDPIGELGGFNVMAVVGNNFINYSDVLGLKRCCVKKGSFKINFLRALEGDRSAIAFVIRAEFESGGDCCPSCCEAVQEVKGKEIKYYGGKKIKEKDFMAGENEDEPVNWDTWVRDGYFKDQYPTLLDYILMPDGNIRVQHLDSPGYHGGDLNYIMDKMNGLVRKGEFRSAVTKFRGYVKDNCNGGKRVTARRLYGFSYHGIIPRIKVKSWGFDETLPFAKNLNMESSTFNSNVPSDGWHVGEILKQDPKTGDWGY